VNQKVLEQSPQKLKLQVTWYQASRRLQAGTTLDEVSAALGPTDRCALRAGSAINQLYESPSTLP
jgi:hypothetical protein